MELKRTIHWTKLAEIQELKEFFAEDFQGFQQLIKAQIEELSKFSKIWPNLQNYALLKSQMVVRSGDFVEAIQNVYHWSQPANV